MPIDKLTLKSTEERILFIMHPVSAINVILILASLKCACCWNTQQSPVNADVDMKVNSGSPGISNNHNITENWFRQNLDHFNPNEKRTYLMKYFQRLDFWQPKGPIILYLRHGLGGGVPIYDYGHEWTLPVTFAKQMHGALFLISQRYYEGIMNLEQDENYFKFLNTTQSLSDITKFIKSIKTNPQFKSSKVLIVGFEEMGALGTWVRLLHPDLVDAVVAVSAPLLAKKDLKEVFDVVHDTYDKYGTKDCIKKMTNYFQSLGEAFDNATELETLKILYHVCEYQNFTLKVDRQLFMENQYGYYTSTRKLSPIDIKSKCTEIPKDLFKIRYADDCNPYQYNKVYEPFWEWPKLYQACSEFGQFPTTDSEKQPFVHWNPLEYYLGICKLYFGIAEQRIDEGVSETNRLFGGLTPNVTNVVFTWGDMDSNRVMGVQKNLSDSAPAFVVNGANNYNVLIYIEDEAKEITEARTKVKSLVKQWLSSP